MPESQEAPQDGTVGLFYTQRADYAPKNSAQLIIMCLYDYLLPRLPLQVTDCLRAETKSVLFTPLSPWHTTWHTVGAQ